MFLIGRTITKGSEGYCMLEIWCSVSALSSKCALFAVLYLLFMQIDLHECFAKYAKVEFSSVLVALKGCYSQEHGGV